MIKYVLGRLAINIPVLVAVTVIVFAFLQFIPGDPIDAYVPPGTSLSAAQRAALRHELGLDQPAPIRYLFWLFQAAHGNFGFRYKNFQPVGPTIASHIPPTLALMSTGMGIGIALGVLFGILSAVYQYSIFDHVMAVVAFLGISMPTFLAGLLALFFLALQLGWFPAGGIETPGEPTSLGDALSHLVLPALVISISYVGILMRYTRSALLEVLALDYVRTARAKGASYRRTVVVHAMPNALLPIITIVGANIPQLIGGAVFTETIFSWPGMGQLFVDGVESRDYPLILAMTLVLAIAVLLANLVTDLMYAVVDPRIRYGS